MDPLPAPAAGHPIRGVIFDLHATLLHGGDPAAWFAAATALLADDPTRGGRFPEAAVGATGPALPSLAALAPIAARIWEHAREIDPNSERDLSPRHHREVYDRLIDHLGIIPAPLADALYVTMPDQWDAYEEAPHVLSTLRQRGVRTAVLSNVGIDPRPALERCGLAGCYDAEVFSFEVGTVKPDRAIFQMAADALGLPPRELLMVGDSPEDDTGAAHLGMRTLILPRNAGTTHGLEQVLRLVG
jgi:HAD superfamily hydrolase (TIGR01509 family)